ncbi:MAG: hypothetical protein ACXVBE_07430 [Bdellovibrionota bacterium]
MENILARAKSSLSLRRELRDIAEFSLGCFLILAIWTLGFHWRGHLSITKGDGLQYLYPFLERLAEVNGNWTELEYDPGWMGGLKLHASYGCPPLFALIALFSHSALAILNFGAMSIQALYGWYTLHIFRMVADKSQPRTVLALWPLRVSVFLFAAFSPLLGWRIGAGHINYSYIIIPAIVSLTLAIESRQLTLTSLFLAIFGLMNGISIAAYQLHLSIIVFGFPIMFALLWDLNVRSIRTYKALLFFSIVAVIGALPHWLEPFLYFSGGDSSRNSGQVQDLYSYYVNGFRDWLGSVFWSTKIIPSLRPVDLGQEFNYPVGPLLLCLPALWWKGYRHTTTFFVLIAITVVLFASNIHPVSDLLLRAIPLLNAFRAPSRSILFVFLYFPLFAGIALAKLNTASRDAVTSDIFSLDALLFFSTLAGVLLLPAWPKEILLWIVAGAIFFRRNNKYPWALLLAIDCIFSFRERIPPFTDFTGTEASIVTTSEKTKAAYPELASPLERVALHYTSTKFYMNTAASLHFGTLNGQWIPLRIHLAWLRRMSGQPLPDYASNFGHDDREESFANKAAFFNVHSVLEFSKDYTSFQVAKKIPTLGAAWIPRSITVTDLPDLPEGRTSSVLESLRSNVWISPAVVSPYSLTGDIPCDRANSPVGIEITKKYFSASFHLPRSGKNWCALVIPMNYTPSFKVSSAAKEMNTFPAYGVLMGIAIPPGIEVIEIETDNLSRRLLFPSYIFSFLLALRGFYSSKKQTLG